MDRIADLCKGFGLFDCVRKALHQKCLVAPRRLLLDGAQEHFVCQRRRHTAPLAQVPLDGCALRRRRTTTATGSRKFGTEQVTYRQIGEAELLTEP